MTGRRRTGLFDANIDARHSAGGTVIGIEHTFIAEELHDTPSAIDQREAIGGAVLDSSASEAQRAKTIALIIDLPRKIDGFIRFPVAAIIQNDLPT